MSTDDYKRGLEGQNTDLLDAVLSSKEAKRDQERGYEDYLRNQALAKELVKPQTSSSHSSSSAAAADSWVTEHIFDPIREIGGKVIPIIGGVLGAIIGAALFWSQDFGDPGVEASIVLAIVGALIGALALGVAASIGFSILLSLVEIDAMVFEWIVTTIWSHKLAFVLLCAFGAVIWFLWGEMRLP